jgi:hypothetical protein
VEERERRGRQDQVDGREGEGETILWSEPEFMFSGSGKFQRNTIDIIFSSDSVISVRNSGSLAQHKTQEGVRSIVQVGRQPY